MAYILRVDGSKEDLDGTDLGTLQDAVGGYIQIVKTWEQDQWMVLDEEGKLKGKPVNIEATRLFDPLLRDPIAGDVVLANLDEID